MRDSSPLASSGPVIVGVSGGVDSAVAALLLKNAGYSVQGLFMSNWEEDDSYCTAAADFQDARRVCEVLDIPLHRVSFADEYRERVFAHFLREYAAGRTPNPDVLCNREIKFGVCLDYMHRLGAAWIATGHYARVRRVIGERPFQEFLSRYLRPAPGPIETEQGRVIGEHSGLSLYTLGQRSGLKIGGLAGADAAPWYVADKDPERNALIVVQSQKHPLLLSDAFDLEQFHWLISPPDRPFECTVKTRYRQADLPCSFSPKSDGRAQVRLSAPASAVTPGQYAVLYQGELCLGGGVIASRFNSRLTPAARAFDYNFQFVEGT